MDALNLIQTLLTTQRLHTQTDVQHALKEHGCDITQSMVSRLFKKLGVVKRVDEAGSSYYALPHDVTPPPPQSSLLQLVLDIHANESMIIIRTSPGSASLIARMLDHAQDVSILGTIAGDDVVFVAPSSCKNINRTLDKIRAMLRL